MNNECFELDLFLLLKYFASKWKIIIAIFFFILAFPLSYVATHKAEYESSGAVLVGRLALETPLYAKSLGLIESSGEISYFYGGSVSVAEVKGTRVVKISAVRLTSAESEEEVNRVINDVLSRHNSCGEEGHLYTCDVSLALKSIRYGAISTSEFSHGKGVSRILSLSFLVAVLAPLMFFFLLGVRSQVVSNYLRQSYAT